MSVTADFLLLVMQLCHYTITYFRILNAGRLLIIEYFYIVVLVPPFHHWKLDHSHVFSCYVKPLSINCELLCTQKNPQ